MKCENCGSEVPDNAAFCPNCGNKMQSSPEQTESEQSQLNQEDEIMEANETEEVSSAPEARDVPPTPDLPASPDIPESPPLTDKPEQITEQKPENIPEQAEPPEAPESPQPAVPVAAPEPPATAFCTQCGNQVNSDTVFCPNCGKKLKQDSSPAAGAAAGTVAGVASASTAANRAYTPSGQSTAGQYSQPARPQYSQPQYSQPQYGQSGYNQPRYGQTGQAYYGAPPTPQTAPKRKKKGLLAAIIILAIIVAIGAIAWIFAGRDIKRMVLGAKRSYVGVETKQMQQYTADLVDALVKEDNDKTSGGRIIDLDFDINGVVLGIDPSLETTLENINLQTTYMYDTNTTDKMYNKLDIMVGQEAVLTVEALKDDDQLIFGLPQILGSYLIADDQELEEVMGPGAEIDMGTLSTVGQLISIGVDMSGKELEKSLNELVDITLKYIDDVEFEKDVDLRAGSVEAVYDTYTVTTTGENLQKMMTEIFELLRDDPNFYDLYYQFSEISMTEEDMDYFPTREDWEYELDMMIEDIADTDEDLENVGITQVVYVDGKDNVKARHITLIDEYDYEILNLQFFDEIEKDGFYAYGINLKDDYGSETSIIAEYEKDGDKKTGIMSMKTDGMDILSADFSDFESFDMADETWYTGEASIMLSAAAAGESIPKLDWSGSYDDERYEFSLGAAEFGTIAIGYQIIDGKQVSIPSLSDVPTIRMSDEEALQGLMTEDVMLNLQNVMTSMGISEEMMSGLFYGGYDDYEDNGDWEDYEDWEEYEDWEDFEDWDEWEDLEDNG